MRFIGRAFYVILFATIVLTASQTLIACGDKTDGDKSQQSDGTDSKKDDGKGDSPYVPCQEYEDNDNEYGYCLYKYSGGFKTVEEIEEYLAMMIKIHEFH